jgi:hypothetical protein
MSEAKNIESLQADTRPELGAATGRTVRTRRDGFDRNALPLLKIFAYREDV